MIRTYSDFDKLNALSIVCFLLKLFVGKGKEPMIERIPLFTKLMIET